MLERATSAIFAPLTGDTFRVTPASGESVDLVLTECHETRYGSGGERQPGDGRMPFSLVFRASDGGLFEQQTCTVEHPALGAFSLFLVPIGPDDRGMGYEAVIA